MEREILCLVLAMIFSATVVVPTLAIFWDRSLPFEYVGTAVISKSVRAGEIVDVKYTINKVRKHCAGRVLRLFFDSAGHQFFVSQTPTIYYRAMQNKDHGTFTRQWRVPEGAAPGKGYYVAYPEFWCNAIQALLPIKSEPQRAEVTILAPPIKIPAP